MLRYSRHGVVCTVVCTVGGCAKTKSWTLVIFWQKHKPENHLYMKLKLQYFFLCNGNFIKTCLKDKVINPYP